MPVIALVGNKGGAGKTTICVNLAAALATEGSVVILDADPQQSAMQWYRIAEGDRRIEVLEAGDDLPSKLETVRDEYDYCLIDCPPSVQSTQMKTALQLADLALVPVLPSPLDLWATVHIEALVDKVCIDNPDLKMLLLINQFEARTRLSRLMQRALAEIALPGAHSMICRRAVYRHAILEGRTVFDFGSKAHSAVEEIQLLANEIESYI